MAKGRDLTDSQRRWLGHLEACAAGGETMSGYASRKGLSVGAMYEAARTLRRKGALRLRAARTDRAASRGSDPAFVRVSLPAARTAGPRWSARLRNGVVVEGHERLGAELVAVLASL